MNYSFKPEDIEISFYNPNSNSSFSPSQEYGCKVEHKKFNLLTHCHAHRSPHENRDEALRIMNNMVNSVKYYLDRMKERLEAESTPESILLEHAYHYWKYANTKHHGAVQWIENEETGELLIYTRGEYRDTLMKNIHSI